MMLRGGFGWFRVLALLALLIPLVACGDEDEEVATEREEVPAVSPEAADELPQDIETLTLQIEDGAFTVDELYLTRGAPTQLQIANADTESYEFAIGDLVTAQEIPAEETVEIGFTTPDEGSFTGELLDADGNVVDEVTVEVAEAGGIT